MRKTAREGGALAAAVFIFLFSLACSVSAERSGEGLRKWLLEAGVIGFYSKGDLKTQDDMETIDLGLRFGFDLKPCAKKFGFEPKGMLEVLYEPFLGAITGPESNVELGVGMLLRYAFPLTQKFYPYIEAGAGPYYMTLQTYEQSTQFNFVDQGGAGFLYFIKEDLALGAGYRFRHISNASIKEPNGGINAGVYCVGLSYFF